MFSTSSALSGSSHSAMEDEDERTGFLSWIRARGFATYLVRIENDSTQLEGSAAFIKGSSHQS